MKMMTDRGKEDVTYLGDGVPWDMDCHTFIPFKTKRCVCERERERERQRETVR